VSNSNFLTSDQALKRIDDLRESGRLTPELFNKTISRIDPGDSGGQTTVLYSGGYKSSFGDGTNRVRLD